MSIGGANARIRRTGAHLKTSPADAPTAQLANYSGGANTSRIAVGSTPLGDGRWEHSDLAGSLNEWVLDLFDAAWYADAAAVEDDPANLSIGAARVTRGGSYAGAAAVIRAARRNSATGYERRIGFRCARSP